MPIKIKSPRALKSTTGTVPVTVTDLVDNAKPSFLEKSDYPIEASIPHGERSNLQLYLQEIGKTPLLTVAEEIVLAKRIRRGDKAARDHMISANLRLVVKIAMDYKDFGLPLLDLISEGNLGLIKAVERFDPQKGGKLSTYAAWWIKQSVRSALASQSKTIRLPVHLVYKISKMRKMATQLCEKLGREPTDEELAIELQIPTSKIAHLKSVSSRPASLDAPIGETDTSGTFGDLIGDENMSNPYENLRDKNRISDLNKTIDSLGNREAEIIKLRFGLDGRNAHTLEQIGRRFNVSRERIRQLERLSFSKMRNTMQTNEAIRTVTEIKNEISNHARLEVIREFIKSKDVAK